jgi:hypothetical protein
MRPFVLPEHKKNKGNILGLVLKEMKGIELFDLV